MAPGSGGTGVQRWLSGVTGCVAGRTGASVCDSCAPMCHCALSRTRLWQSSRIGDSRLGAPCVSGMHVGWGWCGLAPAGSFKKKGSPGSTVAAAGQVGSGEAAPRPAIQHITSSLELSLAAVSPVSLLFSFPWRAASMSPSARRSGLRGQRSGAERLSDSWGGGRQEQPLGLAEGGRGVAGPVKGRIQGHGSEEERRARLGSHCRPRLAVCVQCLQCPGTALAGTGKIVVSGPWSTDFKRGEIDAVIS